jgi:aryl-alcohol dehydrogenase-like predicted oxidoreductase
MDRPDESCPPQHPDRREFIRLTAAAAAAAGAGMLDAGLARAHEVAPPALRNPHTAGAMPTRNLGRTGHRVGLFSLGGQAALEQPDNEDVAIPLIERALELGVNYIDSAAAYGGEKRWSQRYIGAVMKKRRREAFITSKTHDRTRDGSLRLLEESLRLLNTDHIDLWQLHRLGSHDDVEQVFAPGGALEALLQAREQKMVRYLGITGHTEPDALMEAMKRFEFDTVLLAVNAADPHHLPFRDQLIPLAVEQRMGIIGMKIPARGRLLSGWTPPPLEKQRESERPLQPGALTMKEAMHYVLSLPVSTVIVGCDSIAQLEENVAIARDFVPLSEAQLAELSTRAEPVARQSLFFRRWA